MNKNLNKKNLNDFDSISIKIAAPEQIRGWAKASLSKPMPSSINKTNFGEVKKPETINYRTFKPERDGLFCEAIFGPVKNWECQCGKYKRIKHKDQICDRCGVEVTESKVRRERMGYIELAAPVSHVWFFKGLPSRIGLFLDLSLRVLERIIYYESYLVLEVEGNLTLSVTDDESISKKKSGAEYLQVGQVLSEAEYIQWKTDYPTEFRAGMGADSIRELLEKIDLEEEEQDLRQQLAASSSKQKKKKLVKRLQLVTGFKKAGNRPEWMILEVIPVISPDLRPLVALDGGRFATSDLNDLYRRVINRNNRLKRLMELHAPEVIIRNEKRMLQEAVDALIDNGRHGRVVRGPGTRPLKSLSDMLKGKVGRFRQNLLGKRVDYSGRSVIVVGPELQLHQCGIPKEMAVELFKPFIIRKLQERNYAQTIKKAKTMTENMSPKVWEVLEEVIEGHPVLLNRAPTLHRLGIQAFEPQLVEGRAIRIHPLVCKAFNADFDGDQMAVHLPLSVEAQIEAKLLMMASRNVLKPAHGRPIAVPDLDIVLGCSFLTKTVPLSTNGHPIRSFRDQDEAIFAHEQGSLELHESVNLYFDKEKVLGENGDAKSLLCAKLFSDKRYAKLFADKKTEKLFKKAIDTGENVKNEIEDELKLALKVKEAKEKSLLCAKLFSDKKYVTLFAEVEEEAGKPILTTVGRIKFNQVVPDGLLFEDSETGRNLPFVNQEMHASELSDLVSRCFYEIGNRRTVGFLHELKELGFHYATISGISIGIQDMIIPKRKKEMLDEAWVDVSQIESDFQKGLMSGGERYNRVVDIWRGLISRIEDALFEELKKDGEVEGFNPVHIMANSGARSKREPIRQISGLRGLMAKPSGEIIEHPIESCFREGLSVLEYFISTHGARKGLADTAIKTASSGYLTRKLVDVAQDNMITVYDCGTLNGIIKNSGEDDDQELSERVMGRYPAEEVTDPDTGEIIVGRDQIISHEEAGFIREAAVSEIKVRSPLTCEAKGSGLCVKCYGADLSNGQPVDIGEAVGIIAAQSIGEPGTQLTMRTFHTGGTVSGEVESRILANNSGKVKLSDDIDTVIPQSTKINSVMSRNAELKIIDPKTERELWSRKLPTGARLLVKEGDEILKGDPLFESDPYEPIFARDKGIAYFRNVEQNVNQEVDKSSGMSEQVIGDYKDDLPEILIHPEDVSEISLSDKDTIAIGNTPEIAKQYLKECKQTGNNKAASLQFLKRALIIEDLVDQEDRIIVPANSVIDPENEKVADQILKVLGQNRDDKSPLLDKLFGDKKYAKLFDEVEEASEGELSEKDEAEEQLASSLEVEKRSLLYDKLVSDKKYAKLFDGNKTERLFKRAIDSGKNVEGKIRGKLEAAEKPDKTIKVRKCLGYYPLPTGAHMSTIKDGDSVDRGDVLARLPFEASKSSDIVSGLPRVTELFEARKPKDAAFIATIDGKIHLQGISRGMRVLKIINPETDLESETYRIPVGKHLHFQEGEEVRSGEQLTDGPINPHDILSIQGEEAVQNYLVSEVQKVYRAQGERINDKHIETVIRQMLGKVEIGEPGDTEFLGEEEVDRLIFHAMNSKTREEGGEEASAKVILQGITKAALSTESFVSAASFQQTTSVLTKASAIGKKDYLRGLKENVIMGHLIPAGTGLPRFKSIEVSERKLPREEEAIIAEDLVVGDSEQIPAD